MNSLLLYIKWSINSNTLINNTHDIYRTGKWPKNYINIFLKGIVTTASRVTIIILQHCFHTYSLGTTCFTREKETLDKVFNTERNAIKPFN